MLLGGISPTSSSPRAACERAVPPALARLRCSGGARVDVAEFCGDRWFTGILFDSFGIVGLFFFSFSFRCFNC